MNKLYQGDSSIIQTKKTVDWLVNNTQVKVFNPMTFEGYQRNIDEKHCDQIVAYLSQEFFLPTSIICSCDGEFSPDKGLYIVDGQHRVRAFELLKDRNPDRYNAIKDYELSVVVLENVKEEVEIDTFITINKKTKRVDTSLAFVLKNKLNYKKASKDIKISKREFLSVELASRLNGVDNIVESLWGNRISFEGTPAKQSPQLISLNAFVKSMRALLGCLENQKVISIDWNSAEELNECVYSALHITNHVWYEVQNKWPELFDSNLDKRRIIQGSIGFTAINRFLIHNLKRHEIGLSIEEFLNQTSIWIRSIQCPWESWLPGNAYSKYSSEAGFSIITQELIDRMR